MNKITLRQAREMRGFTLQEVTEKTGITLRSLQRWEKDCRKMSYNECSLLVGLYRISADYIHIGPEETAPARVAPASKFNLESFFDKMVKAGRTQKLYELLPQMLQEVADYDKFESPEEREEITTKVRREFEKGLARAIKRNTNHCGQQVKVTSGCDFETGEHSILVRCECCGQAHIIKSVPATANSENGQRQ